MERYTGSKIKNSQIDGLEDKQTIGNLWINRQEDSQLKLQIDRNMKKQKDSWNDGQIKRRTNRQA